MHEMKKRSECVWEPISYRFTRFSYMIPGLKGHVFHAPMKKHQEETDYEEKSIPLFTHSILRKKMSLL